MPPPRPPVTVTSDAPTATQDRQSGLRLPGEIAAGLALLGLLAFVVCYSYERSFYATFTVSPEDVGQSYSVILGKAATGVALLAALAAPGVLVPWLMHRLRTRGQRVGETSVRRTVFAFGRSIAVNACYSGLLAVIGSLPLLAGIGTGLLVGLAGVLVLLARQSARGGRDDRTALIVAGGSVAFLLLVVAAYQAGTSDSLRLLRLTRATGTASPWQMLLAMNTPAATIRWTPPGTTKTQTTVGRIIGSVDGMLLVYDLESCSLRRLTGDITAGTRLVGATLGRDPDGRRGSVLPRCPRSA